MPSSPPPDPSPRRPESGHWLDGLGDASRFAGLGLQVGVTVVVFVAGGYGLDRWLGTVPWFTIAGALLGMVAMFVQLFRLGRELNRISDATRKKRAARDNAADAASPDAGDSESTPAGRS